MPGRPNAPTFRRRAAARPAAAGFTLIELLVVIGIVVLLVAILLPTISKVRIVANDAKTQAEMVSIADAIERYHGDHRAYPGVVRNAEITVSSAGTGFRANPAHPDDIGGDLTMSENLVLTLCGGFTYREASPGVAGPPGVKFADIGKGPLNLSPFPAKRTRQPPYLDVAPGRFLSSAWNPEVPATGRVNGPDGNPLEMAGTPYPPWSDSNVPEFVDAHADPKPIIYLRAVVGGRVIPDARPLTAPDDEEYNRDDEQYNIAHAFRYRRKEAPGEAFDGDFYYHPNSKIDYRNSYQLLKHPSVPDSPRGKDKYLLLTAGKDRRFGTTDDIFVGG